VSPVDSIRQVTPSKAPNNYWQSVGLSLQITWITLKIFIPVLAIHFQQYRAQERYSMSNIKILQSTKISLCRIMIVLYLLFLLCQSLCKHPFGYSICLKDEYVLCVKIKYLVNIFTLCLLRVDSEVLLGCTCWSHFTFSLGWGQ